MKLVSFIMPTRNPHEMLINAITSIHRNCGSGRDDYEILLRVDEDDKARHPVAQEITRTCGRTIIGQRGIGYSNMSTFVDELVAVADSKWCWLFDDDAWVEGDWYSALSDIPCNGTDGPAVNAEFYVLGESFYRNGHNPPGMLMPTAFVKTLKHTTPVDDQWLAIAKEKHWSIWQLIGVCYHHDGRPRISQ